MRARVLLNHIHSLSGVTRGKEEEEEQAATAAGGGGGLGFGVEELLVRVFVCE